MLVSKMHFANISTINLTKLFFPLSQLLGNFIAGAGSLFSCLTGRAPFYRPKLLLRKGNVCTSVCQEFCPQDGGGCIPAYTGADTPLPLGRHWDTDPPPLSACWDTPPPGSHCSGRYTSYWNAFLSSKWHWWIPGGVRDAPYGPNPFIFMQFSTKKLVSTLILGVGTDTSSGQSWIHQGIGGSIIFQMGAQPGKNLLLCMIFAKNCIRMNIFDRGAGRGSVDGLNVSFSFSRV